MVLSISLLQQKSHLLLVSLVEQLPERLFYILVLLDPPSLSCNVTLTLFFLNVIWQNLDLAVIWEPYRRVQFGKNEVFKERMMLIKIAVNPDKLKWIDVN